MIPTPNPPSLRSGYSANRIVDLATARSQKSANPPHRGGVFLIGAGLPIHAIFIYATVAALGAV